MKCANCGKVETIARQAVVSLGVEAQVVKVTNRADFAHYGLLATPGLVINEKLVCGGRIPEEAEVVSWLATALS